MADIDIDPFGEHDKMDNCPDEGKAIPLNLMGESKTGSSWQPEFGGEIHNVSLMKSYVERLYKKLSEVMGQQTTKQFISTILNSEMVICTSETRVSH